MQRNAGTRAIFFCRNCRHCCRRASKRCAHVHTFRKSPTVIAHAGHRFLQSMCMKKFTSAREASRSLRGKELHMALCARGDLSRHVNGENSRRAG